MPRQVKSHNQRARDHFIGRVWRVARIQSRAMRQSLVEILPERTARTKYFDFDVEYPSRSLVGRTIRRGEVWDMPLCGLVDQVGPGSTVVDIGANIGISTLTMIAARKDIRVVCFEPASRYFPFLERNIRRNHLEASVTCVFRGISENAGNEILHINSTTASAAVAKYGHRRARSEVMTCIPLDEYFRDRADVPALIKIDTDGFEVEVVKSGRSVLGRYHPLLFLEFSPALLESAGHDPMELLELLLALGYRSADVFSPRGDLLQGGAELFNVMPIGPSYVDLALRA
jgi:FkbM family methyltransferase